MKTIPLLTPGDFYKVTLPGGCLLYVPLQLSRDPVETIDEVEDLIIAQKKLYQSKDPNYIAETVYNWLASQEEHSLK